MKKIVTCFIFLLTFSGIQYGKATLSHPEKIYSITRVSKPYSYYEVQAKLWKKEVEKNQSNPDAWFNYFQAARYANLFSDGAQPFNLEGIVAQLPAVIPNAAELPYIQYIQNGRGADNFHLLLKAYEIAPLNENILHDMVTYREVNGQREQMRQLVEQWYASGEMPTSLLKWNYNVLMSIEDNAILLTWGDNDTYPIWMLQLLKKTRPDVVVLNAYLMWGFPEYRSRMLERGDIAPLDAEQEVAGIAEMVAHIVKHSKRNLYFNPSIPSNIRKAHEDNLYLTGLAFKYSEKSFDNVAVLKNNYENKFLKDYLLVDFDDHLSQDVINQANLNYLPPFLQLHKHYKASGEQEKATQLEKLIKNIAIKGGREKAIQNYLEEPNPKGKILDSMLPVKKLTLGKVKVKGNLYAHQTEVTNAEYEAFLMDLVKNKAFDKLDICKNEKTDWNSLLPDYFKNLSEEKIYQNGHPEDPRNPVVNINHEAAELYCEWITKVYNQSNHKKKLYEKVKFRLPTEEEWEYAASSGKSDFLFPWDGMAEQKGSAINLKGCYLSNFKITEPCEDCPSFSADGGVFSVRADSYFPNDFGLYGMSGNVAEMLQKQGIAKGGSWDDAPKDCQIKSRKSYSTANPAIGFRVFMEVLEYKK